jgi:hypothetical protein
MDVIMRALATLWFVIENCITTLTYKVFLKHDKIFPNIFLLNKGLLIAVNNPVE